MRLVKLFLFTVILTFTCHAFGQSNAESSADLKRQQASLQREIDQLNRSLEQTSSSKRLSQRQINELNAKIRIRQEKINVMSSQIKVLDNQISDNTNTISSLQTQLNKLKKEYAGMVLFAFRNQSSYNKLMFVFASQNFNQAYKRLKYLQQFTEYRKKQAKYIQQTQKDLGAKIVELDQNKKEKSDVLRAQEKEKQMQLEAKADQARVLSNLTRQERQYQQDLNQKQREAANLRRRFNEAINREIELARKAAEEEARSGAAKAKAENREAPATKPLSTSANVLTATPEAAKLSADFLENRGRLPWPVAQGIIVEEFGQHTTGVNVKTNNDGVDIKTNEGSTVRSVFSGTVTTVFTLEGKKAVLINHGEYFTAYSNLKSVSVTKGQKVSVKQAIGTVFTDPDDGTTQVHFEIRKVSTPIDPEIWLARSN
jgi:septal ring factor EnvC (AmiA/AmiB activator)